MWKLISKTILRNRTFFLIALFILTVFMAYKASFVKLEYQYAQMLSEKDSIAIKYKQFKQLFGDETNNLIVGITDPDFFHCNKINDWMDLVDSLKKIDGVLNILSVSDALNITKDSQSKKFIPEKIFKQKIESQTELDSLKRVLFSLPFYKGLLYNDSSNVFLTAIKVSSDKINSKERYPLINSIEKLTENYANKHNIAIHYSGLPYTRAKIAKMIENELVEFIFIAMFVTALILYILFRSLKVVVFSMLVVAIGVIWSLGSMVLFGYDITILTGMIPPLMIVIGIPNCVYLLNKYHSEYSIHGNKMRALFSVIHKIGVAAFMTNLTTAAGFATFIITSNRILIEFGIIASLNVMGMFLLSLILIPIFFSYLSPPSVRHVKHLDYKVIKKIIDKLCYLPQHQRITIYSVVGVLIVVAIFGIAKMKIEGYIIDDIPKDNPVYVDLKYFERNFKGVMPLEISIDTKKKKGATRLTILNKIDELQKILNNYDCISKAMSVADLVKFLHQSYFNGSDQYYSIPDERVGAMILPYLKNEATKYDLLNSFVDSTGQVIRVTMRVEDIGTNRMQELYKELQFKVDSIFPPGKYITNVTGSSIIYSQGTSNLVHNLYSSLGLAVILISLFMAILFSTWRMILISLVPNILPLTITAAVMGYFNIPIKPSTILVFSISYGISVDSAIHFLSKYRQELLITNWNIGESVLLALKETGVSIIYTASILFFGFGIFVYSDFGGTVALGLLISLTLLVAMLTNLILLPSLLLSLEKLITTRAFEKPIFDFEEEENGELNSDKLTEKEIANN